MFSSRVPGDLGPNSLAAAVERMRLSGREFDDLTVSNPTDAAIEYPEGLLDGLSDPKSLLYEPQPFGLPLAREAVSAEYARRGVRVPASHIVLTASSSESYALLFKLLCDPGESVLVPTPSYPLFEHLTRLDCVHALPYRTEYHGTWTIDLEDLRYAIDETTRAILVVSPNNPTGEWLKREELTALVELCAAHHLVLDRRRGLRRLPDRSGARRRAQRPRPGRRADGQSRRAVQGGGPAAVEARVDGAAGAQPR